MKSQLSCVMLFWVTKHQDDLGQSLGALELRFFPWEMKERVTGPSYF